MTKKVALAVALVMGGLARQPLAAQTPIAAVAPNITLVYSTVFYEDPGPANLLPLRVDLTPAEARSLIPPRSGKYAMVGMTCHRIAADRHLEGCQTDTDPKDYDTVGQQLAKKLVVDPAFPVITSPPVKFISIQFRVQNSDTPATEGPCWPPSCILEPSPPPPPQSRH